MYWNLLYGNLMQKWFVDKAQELHKLEVLALTSVCIPMS